MSGCPDLDALVAALDEFVTERNWAQFHAPKNLVMALSAEVGELTEHFMWLDAEQSDALPPDQLREVGDEIADVLIYLVHLSRRLGVDLFATALRKVEAASAKYPAETHRAPGPDR